MSYLIFFLVLVISTLVNERHALKDSRRIIKGAHVSRVIYRAFFWVCISAIFWWTFDLTVIQGIALFIAQWGIFAVQFDQFYNYHKDNTSLYLGNQAFQDRLLRKHPVIMMLIDNYLLIVGVITYFA